MLEVPTVHEVIEQEMAALTKEEYLRPGMSYNDFAEEVTNTFAQAQEDKKSLVDAGFDWSRMPKYIQYLQMLSLEHGKRVSNEGIQAEVQEQYKDKMPQADAIKKVLLVVIRYIVKRTNDSKDKRVYEIIRDGYGDMDTLQDILASISFIGAKMELAAQVRPGGIVVDQAYLDSAETLALHLVKLKGEVTAAADEGSEYVDRQNQLITLCIQALREIKLFAEIAYYDNPDHYDEFYASDRKREINKKYQEAEKVDDSSIANE